ncbi:TPA: DUF551 domain-containing protein [Escherichia coli]|nr:DUF551 domain-containing protein [Escherichia coli]
MTTITKERAEIKSFITGFLSDPAHDNQSSDSLLANVFRIALASLEAEPVAWMRDDADGREYNARNEFSGGGGGIPLYATPQVQVVPEEATPENVEMLSGYVSTYKLTDSERDIAAEIWNACRAAMLHAGNFRENKNSSTNNFREIAETSTNYPVIPDGWISCSERMPENIPGSCKEYLVFDGLNNKVHHDYWVVPDGDSAPVASFWNHYGAHVTHWMPLPEPPKEVNRG